MNILDAAIYVIGLLFAIVGYFLNDLVSKVKFLHDHKDAEYIKLLEFKVEAQHTYATKAELTATITRLENRLDDIAKDIKEILKEKADKE